MGACSPSSRRCRALRLIGFAAAAIALLPTTGRTQTAVAAGGDELLQPLFDGNPAVPPRFRRPGERPPPAQAEAPAVGKFTAPPAPSRIGATPVYGSPTGFGAGDTGFDSANRPRRKRATQVQPVGIEIAPPPETTFTPVPTFAPPAPAKAAAKIKPPTAVIYPARAATRIGALLPLPPDEPSMSNPPPEVHPRVAANRPGAVPPVPPSWLFDGSAAVLPPFDSSASSPPPGLPMPNTLPLGTPPPRPLPIAAGDPYAALGIRAGSFLLLPSVDLSSGYSTNPERAPGNPSAVYFVIGPELQVRSDWERHSLTADISGTYTEYAENLQPSLNVPYLNSKIDGRIDVSRETQILLEDRVIIATDNPGSPNLNAGLAKLPINTDLGGTVGLAQQFNRLSVTVKGTFDRTTYDDSLLTNGQSASNADRNFDQTAGILRLAYDLDPGLKPFVEIEGDERIHDEQFDRNGLERDSVGASARAGAAVDLFGSLTGEMAVGYLKRVYQDPTLPDVGGAVADGALTWQATALTTVKLSAASQVYETIIPGASGQFSHDLTLQMDHAFLVQLIGTLKAGYGTDDYVGSALRDTRYFASAGLTYKLNRDVQLRGEVRQDWQTATEASFSYTATSFLIGLRLQR